MDIPRKDLVRKRRFWRIVYSMITLTTMAAITFALSRLEPAAPSLERATVFVDSVGRGDMVLDVRGLGTLIPEVVLLIPARDEGRVERRLLLPGVRVEPETVLFELSNPELEQELFDAQSELRAAEADYADLQAQLEMQRVDQAVTAAQVESEYLQTKTEWEANQELANDGLTDQVTLRISKVKVERLELRLQLEKERLEVRETSVKAQLAAQQVRIDQARGLVRLREKQLDRLTVRAGASGVLQQLEVEVGQLVTPGTVMARVSDPLRLKAALKIAETQAKDITFGQRAEIDTRNGVIQGTVMRIDPAVLEGTVTVDIRLEGELPRGARPDLSVDGRIVLDHLRDVVKMGRPVYAQPNSTISLFRLEPDGLHAGRIQATVGRTSVNEIEIRQGLQPGDQVILSDMSAWDEHDRIRLK